MTMKRTSVNLWLDVVSLLVMLSLVVTGGLMYFVLPPGTGHTHFLFGLGRHDFGQVHFYLAVAAVVLMALHVALHWNWVCCVIGKAFGNPRPSRSAQLAWGVSLLSGLMLLSGAGVWWASANVEQHVAQSTGRGERGLRQHGFRAFRRGEGRAEEALAARESAARESARESCDTGEAGEGPCAEGPGRAAAGKRAAGHGARRDKHLESCPSGAAIDGSTTLWEAAEKAGMTVEQMRERLKLPGGVDPGQRLGRLKRWYGLSLHDVRRLVCRAARQQALRPAPNIRVSWPGTWPARSV